MTFPNKIKGDKYLTSRKKSNLSLPHPRAPTPARPAASAAAAAAPPLHSLIPEPDVDAPNICDLPTALQIRWRVEPWNSSLTRVRSFLISHSVLIGEKHPRIPPWRRLSGRGCSSQRLIKTGLSWMRGGTPCLQLAMLRTSRP